MVIQSHGSSKINKEKKIFTWAYNIMHQKIEAVVQK